MEDLMDAASDLSPLEVVAVSPVVEDLGLSFVPGIFARKDARIEREDSLVSDLPAAAKVMPPAPFPFLSELFCLEGVLPISWPLYALI
jgi:hypothetical protein